MVGLVLAPFEALAATKKHRKAPSVSTIKHGYASKAKKSSYKRVQYKRVTIRKSHQLRDTAPLIAADRYDGSSPLTLASTKALIVNQNTNEIIYAKNTNAPAPIASVTKLMTAMVVLESGVDMQEVVTVTNDDVDYLKGTSSRLPLGTRLTRNDMLHLALIASENRAASVLATTFPGGKAKFVQLMNQKAQSLGMSNSYFVDSTGLNSNNVSTAEDLVKMVNAAHHVKEIHDISTMASHEVYLANRHAPTLFRNTNILVRNGGDWNIGLSKTGFINEAGRCLVMQANLAGEPVIMVLLDSNGKYSRIGDANRIKKWVEHHNQVTATQQADLDAMVDKMVVEELDDSVSVGQVYWSEIFMYKYFGVPNLINGALV